MMISRFNALKVIYLFASFFITISASRAQQAEPAKQYIEFIVDASASMAEIVDGKPAFEILKQVISAQLASAPSEIDFALRVYGHRVDANDREKSCNDSELVVPFGSGSEKILAALKNLKPRGFTTIGYSLKQVPNDFAVVQGAKGTVILLSDGEETCGEDPLKAYAELREQGFELKIFTVGFRVGEAAASELSKLAKVSAGQYAQALKVRDLDGALSQTLTTATGLQKVKADANQDRDAGSDFESALKIDAKFYAQNYLSSKDSKDVYYFDSKAGEKYFVSIKIEQGLWPKLNLRVVDAKQTVLFEERSNGPPEFRSDVLEISEDGKVYIEIELLEDLLTEKVYSLTLEKVVALD